AEQAPQRRGQDKEWQPMTRRPVSTAAASKTRYGLGDDAATPASPPAAPGLPTSPPVPAEQLVAEAMEMAKDAGGGVDLPALVHRYWRRVPDAEIDGRTPGQLLANTQEHLDLARQRLVGELRLEVRRESDRTAILVVTDDMPFLVDSVTAAVSEAGYEVD